MKVLEHISSVRSGSFYFLLSDAINNLEQIVGIALGKNFWANDILDSVVTRACS